VFEVRVVRVDLQPLEAKLVMAGDGKEGFYMILAFKELVNFEGLVL